MGDITYTFKGFEDGDYPVYSCEPVPDGVTNVDAPNQVMIVPNPVSLPDKEYSAVDRTKYFESFHSNQNHARAVYASRLFDLDEPNPSRLQFTKGNLNHGVAVVGGGRSRKRAPVASKTPKWTSTGRKTTLKDGIARTLYRGPGGELRVRRIRQGKAVYVKV